MKKTKRPTTSDASICYFCIADYATTKSKGGIPVCSFCLELYLTEKKPTPTAKSDFANEDTPVWGAS